MIEPMVCRTGLALLTALALSACASSSRPINQEVALRTSEGGERVEARCDVSNDKSSWTVVAPTTLGVTRSERPLTVECRTADGSKGTRVFDAVKYGELPGGGSASYSYPSQLELVLVRAGKSDSVRVVAPSFAQIDDVSKLPKVGDDGREGYRRFLAGESPRAFAISEKGLWVRVNAVRGAPRLALERCQSYGGRCRLYAVDDEVVWDTKRDRDLVAAF